ncbi:indolepyruvate oxidoreductase subunit beta [Desulfobacca acetoxidans]|uniref:Indolepyruvate ferredoxin oxidoreductase n=1 Tax=Desulfobacca acetoxidans (strain ATCC 700848 / DSM 11109 / ASRB2) TaxID=880072 RepID=F2NIH9_DESAR|nr:indolepyruvate oxidoreductase subunit beta [Desulfobacca acetoxidans]AEB10381.1 Indolepyruvate ferredoxin oxidoreductase [Desulfobacca acetoxidans DSM 11109]
MPNDIKLRIFCTGVGGQGTLLATRLLGEAAMAAGFMAQVSETHGMAQRGGVVESTLVLGALSSPIISLGEADILIGFEVLETFRSLNRCHANTLVVTNIGVNVPYTVATGQTTYPPVAEMLNILQDSVGRLIGLNANDLALQAGSALAVNMVLLGALLSTGRLPFEPEILVKVVQTHTPSKHLTTNLQAFNLGREAAMTLTAAPIHK